MQFAKLLSIGLTLSLSGCFPYATSYVHIDTKDVKRVNEICRQYGAPAAAIYEIDGVRFELNLDPSKANYYKLPGIDIVAPPNITLSMPDAEVRFTLDGETKARMARLESKSVKRDPSGTLSVSQTRAGNRRYRFDLSELPPLSSSGSFELPPIYANGVLLKLPAFSFERRGFVGIVPLNC